MSTRISAICALSTNSVIGAKNQLPWRITEDSRRFRALTMGLPVIVGRKTYESIGRHLDGRTVIVLTRQPDYQASGCEITDSVDAALRMAMKHQPAEIFIAGGGELYSQTIGLCERLYLTLIDGHFEGDTAFPDFSDFDLVISREHRQVNGLEYDFVVLERSSKGGL